MSAVPQRPRSPWLLVALFVALSAATSACGKKEEDGGYSIPSEPGAIQSCPDGTADCTAR